MIEPPSVPESSTACMAMVESTSSTSRLELTASPTSRSASSSLDLAWRARRCATSSSCTSLTPLTAIAAWPANAVTIAISRSSNGLTSLRQSDERADDLVVEEHRRAHRGAEAGDPLEVVAAVVGIGQHVGDLLGPAVEPDPADQRVAVERHRVLGDEGDRLARRGPIDLISSVDAAARGGRGGRPANGRAGERSRRWW